MEEPNTSGVQGSAGHELVERDAADTSELLARLLDGEASPAQRRAERLIATSGSLRRLAARVDEPGLLAPMERARLRAALEIGRRMLVEARPGAVLDTPRSVVARYRDLAMADVEVLVVVGLDPSQRGIVEHRMVGAVDGVQARPRDLLRPVLAAGATGLIVVHNHPSGNPAASPGDLAFTARLRAAAQLCGLMLVDHVIVASGGWTSLRVTGRLGTAQDEGVAHLVAAAGVTS
ncbi:MAG: JAB domain-containing protein [Myxococcota bacterium]